MKGKLMTIVVMEIMTLTSRGMGKSVRMVVKMCSCLLDKLPSASAGRRAGL